MQDTHSEGSSNDTAENYFEEIFQVDNVQTGSWLANIKVHSDTKKSQLIRFKLDTGASLSVCRPRHCVGSLNKTTKKLYKPGHTPLQCLGVMSCKMSAGKETISEEIYVVDK